MKLHDIVGKRFGKLIVLKEVGVDETKNRLYLCECDCGNLKVVRGRSLKTGNTKSCGCYKREIIKQKNTKHNLRNTKLYKVWSSIKDRCLNKNCKAYKNYGGRGIDIYKEWETDFISFYEWSIKNGYVEGLTIDRIDNNKGYCPENCRWTTKCVQSNNRRNNVVVFNGTEHTTLSMYCRKNNLPYKLIVGRIEDGWSIERAINTPKRNVKA